MHWSRRPEVTGAADTIEALLRDHSRARDAMMGGAEDEDVVRMASHDYFVHRLEEIRTELWPHVPRQARSDLGWAFENGDASGALAYLREPPQGRTLGPMLWVLVGAGAFILVGVVLIVARNAFEEQAVDSEDWPTVPGRVVETRVDKENSTRSTHDSGFGGSRSSHYTPKVAYEYEVNGIAHRSDRLWFDGSVADEARAQSLVAPYAVGDEVTVHYNPGNPSEAVLQTGTGSTGYAMLTVGGLFVGLGLLGIGAAIRFRE